MTVRAGALSAQSRRIEAAVRRAAAGRKLVLAVSGGRDSMALLHAVARTSTRSVQVVATFDHGTGPLATRAAELVAAEAAGLGFPVVLGRAAVAGNTEGEWREARWRFLAEVAARADGMVTTAHTRDDQVETILMRVLRDSGARGLAALLAPSDTLRPFLEWTRADVARYASDVGARWMEDPLNTSPRYLRNRVRHDLLPALERVHAGFAASLLDLSRGAAHWRQRLDVIAASLSRIEADGSRLSVPVEALAPYTPAELAVLWPAFAARLGLAMDWRGTERAAAFTSKGDATSGARIPLSGGWDISRTRDAWVLQRTAAPDSVSKERRLEPGMRWDGWRFEVAGAMRRRAADDPWLARLPANAPLTVRRWEPGDRIRLDGEHGRFRKVKRFLSDARVASQQRGRWPVVLAGDEIVWIPGVRRSDAAAVRPGRPGVVYRCELDDR